MQKQDYYRFVLAANAQHLDLTEVDIPLLFHLIYNLIALTLNSLQTQIGGFSETRKSKMERERMEGHEESIENGKWFVNTYRDQNSLNLLSREILL